MNQTEISAMIEQAKGLQKSLQKMAKQAMKDMPKQLAKLTDNEKIKLATEFGVANISDKINELKKQMKDVNNNK